MIFYYVVLCSYSGMDSGDLSPSRRDHIFYSDAFELACKSYKLHNNLRNILSFPSFRLLVEPSYLLVSEVSLRTLDHLGSR